MTQVCSGLGGSSGLGGGSPVPAPENPGHNVGPLVEALAVLGDLVPVTRAGYAALLLTGLAALGLVVELVEFLSRGYVDPGVISLTQGVILAAVGALVYTVHLNGGPRSGGPSVKG